MGRFYDRLQRQWNDGKFVCVGLDPDIAKILPRGWEGSTPFPGHKVVFTQYLISIIDATQDLVCAYKPNTAFFEAYGSDGIQALEDVVDYIRDKYPNVVIILDAKRADIGNTNQGTALFAFSHLDCDAITVHPYMGHVAMEPFLREVDRGVIVLVRTSNDGAGELQDRLVTIESYKEAEELNIPSVVSTYMNGYDQPKTPLYQYLAASVRARWNHNSNCAVVVGATAPRELLHVRELVGDDIPILIPGVGAQGGDLATAVLNGKNSRGDGFIINASRSVLYPTTPEGQPPIVRVPAAAREEVMRMNDVIRQTLFTPPPGNDV